MPVVLCLFWLLGAVSCGSPQYAVGEDSAVGQDSLRQGILGKVVWVEGNQMPTVGVNNETTKSSRDTAIVRTVYIYTLTHQDEATMEDGFYTSIDTELVSEVTTDQQGQFQTALPPGRYSLFVKEPKGWYANLYDGEGHIHPVTVAGDSVSEVVIKVDYEAVY